MEITLRNNLSTEASGSTVINTAMDYGLSSIEQVVSLLCRTVEELQKNVVELKTQKMVDETELSSDILKENGLLPEMETPLPTHNRRGRGHRPLLRHEIEEAIAHSSFGAQQARYLRVSLQTYRKYAKLYGLWNPRPNTKGSKNPRGCNSGKHSIDKILNNECPNISDFLAKKRWIESGRVEPKCNICGYNKARLPDKKIALLLDHKDGDLKNFSEDNLQLLCFNCTFECGRGYIRSGRKTFDVDWIQSKNQDWRILNSQ